MHSCNASLFYFFLPMSMCPHFTLSPVYIKKGTFRSFTFNGAEMNNNNITDCIHITPIVSLSIRFYLAFVTNPH